MRCATPYSLSAFQTPTSYAPLPPPPESTSPYSCAPRGICIDSKISIAIVRDILVLLIDISLFSRKIRKLVDGNVEYSACGERRPVFCLIEKNGVYCK